MGDDFKPDEPVDDPTIGDDVDVVAEIIAHAGIEPGEDDGLAMLPSEPPSSHKALVFSAQMEPWDRSVRSIASGVGLAESTVREARREWSHQARLDRHDRIRRLRRDQMTMAMMREVAGATVQAMRALGVLLTEAIEGTNAEDIPPTTFAPLLSILAKSIDTAGAVPGTDGVAELAASIEGVNQSGVAGSLMGVALAKSLDPAVLDQIRDARRALEEAS